MVEVCKRWAHLSPNTRLGRAATLRRLLDLLSAPSACWKAIPHTKAPAPRMVVVSDEDFERTLQCSDAALAFVLLAARDAGLRSGTIMRLTLENFMNGMVSTRTKFGGFISVPSSRRLEALVETARMRDMPGVPIYQALTGGPSSYSGMMHKLHKAQEKAKCKGRWQLHDLRRTAAHRLYAGSQDLRDVRDLLGHAHLGSTLHYLAARQNAVRPEKLAIYASGKEENHADTHR